MSFSILNNMAGINAQNQLNLNSVNLNNTLLRMSSGKRINSGADDAAGLGIADTLAANVRALNQGVQNANDGISVAQIADGALQQITSLLTRGVTLAEEAATDTVDSTGKTALNNELTSIKTEITRIATQTNYNGVSLFDQAATSKLTAGQMHVFVGDLASQSSVSVNVGTLITAGSVTNLGGTILTPSDSTVSLTSAANAQSAITSLKTAIASVSSERANIGAGINSLQSAVAVLQTQSQNTTAAESNIRDANMAQEIANMTKYQILAQSGIAALSQANQSSQLVLKLLQ